MKRGRGQPAFRFFVALVRLIEHRLLALINRGSSEGGLMCPRGHVWPPGAKSEAESTVPKKRNCDTKLLEHNFCCAIQRLIN